jgi:transposase-like protein
MSPREETHDGPTPPPEFRQRAVQWIQLREQPLAKIVSDLGVSESWLRRWVRLTEDRSSQVGGRAG